MQIYTLDAWILSCYFSNHPSCFLKRIYYHILECSFLQSFPYFHAHCYLIIIHLWYFIFLCKFAILFVPFVTTLPYISLQILSSVHLISSFHLEAGVSWRGFILFWGGSILLHAFLKFSKDEGSQGRGINKFFNNVLQWRECSDTSHHHIVELDALNDGS